MVKGLVCFCSFFAFSQHLPASSIADPVRYFLEDRPLTRTDVLLRIDMDVDHDGKKEVYLSLERFTNGKAGNEWDVFVPEKIGYTWSAPEV